MCRAGYGISSSLDTIKRSLRGICAVIVLELSAHVNLTSTKSSYSISDDTYNSTCIKAGSELRRD